MLIINFIIFTTLFAVTTFAIAPLKLLDKILPNAEYFPYSGGGDQAFYSGDTSPRGIEPTTLRLYDVRRWMKESRTREWGNNDDLVYFYDYEVHDTYNKLVHIQCACFSTQTYCSCDKPSLPSIFLHLFDRQSQQLILRDALFPHRNSVEAFTIEGFTVNGTFPNSMFYRELKDFKQGEFLKPRNTCHLSPGFCELLSDIGLVLDKVEFTQIK